MTWKGALSRSGVVLAIVALVPAMMASAASRETSGLAPTSCASIALPLERHAFDLTVSVDVLGRTVQFAFDLGASDSYILKEGRARLVLPPVRDPPNWAVDDINGARTQTEFVAVASIRLGGIERGPRIMPVTDLDYPSDSEARRSEMGLLGIDLLKDYDLDLDASANRLVLYPIAAPCSIPPPAWTAGATSVPLRFLNGGSPLVPISINDRMIEAVFDTGSERTRIKDPSRGLDDELESLDLLGPANPTGRFPLRNVRLALGDVVETGFPVRVVGADDALGGRSVLGIDFIGKYRFWLSRRVNRLFIAAPPPR